MTLSFSVPLSVNALLYQNSILVFSGVMQKKTRYSKPIWLFLPLISSFSQPTVKSKDYLFSPPDKTGGRSCWLDMAKLPEKSLWKGLPSKGCFSHQLNSRHSHRAFSGSVPQHVFNYLTKSSTVHLWDFYDHPKHIQKHLVYIFSHSFTITLHKILLHLVFYYFEDTPHPPSLVFLSLQGQIESSSYVMNTYITVHCTKFKVSFSYLEAPFSSGREASGTFKS